MGTDTGTSAQARLLEIGQMITKISGVQLGQKQLNMIESRLSKRASDLGLVSVHDYYDFLMKNKDEELPFLIGILTTHHTYFFREFSHFEHLTGKTIEALVENSKKRGDRIIRVWSAACSRGQEVYSLAMWLQKELARFPEVALEILGSDIDPDSVATAKNGVYHWKEVKEIPLQFLSANWIRGIEDLSDFAKAKKGLRSNCRFEVDNLIDPKSQHLKKFDLIFCRNVFIYFTPEQIKKITENLLKVLQPEGLLYLGISESLHGLGLPVSTKGPSIYVHTSHAKPGGTEKMVVSTPAPRENPSPRPIRVLCVDDSPTIHSILKQILLEKNGFEIVGKAMNGIEAHRLVSELKPDVLTLDIHMPEQTGIEYLEKHFKPGHPPVVMMTSVSRENSDLATRALELGASDFVEKPSLSDMLLKGEEIRAKLRCAFELKATPQRDLSVDRSFGKVLEIKNIETKIRILTLSFSERAKITSVLNEWKGSQPGIVIAVEGKADVLGAYAKTLEKQLRRTVRVINSSEAGSTILSRSEVYLISHSDLKALQTRYYAKRASILVFGQSTPAMDEALSHWKGAQILLEDRGGTGVKSSLSALASDTLPATSFAYVSDEFLCKAA